ncbi:ATP-binding protein [Actinosynnema sp. NPDC053489]|uniref:ATP-binding protein n=1 Tax=Actinosynnema sp. NPDC053489 TaxID=3363916 RepID=UPI0037C7153F
MAEVYRFLRDVPPTDAYPSTILERAIGLACLGDWAPLLDALRDGDDCGAAAAHNAVTLIQLAQVGESVGVTSMVDGANATLVSPLAETIGGVSVVVSEPEYSTPESIAVGKYEDVPRVRNAVSGPVGGVAQAGVVHGDVNLSLLSSPPVSVVPRQLPAARELFTGRVTELDELDRILAAADSSVGMSATAVISAIGGAGGVGKTWLALAWAHRHVERFPDGQLFIDLRGFSPMDEPVAPAEALRGFLTSLGADRKDLPTDLGALAGLYRSLVTDKRMLVVLDNAATTEQVVPLLPGTGSCTVLVTSRHRLTGLVVNHGARPVSLGVLSDVEAHALLTASLGVERIVGEEHAVATLIRLCGGFPLALGVIAARARIRPHQPLDELAAELREFGLDALDDDDPAASLPAVLSWSLRHLTSEQSVVFGLLGIAPGSDLSLPAAVSLTGLSPARTRKVLHALENASLINRNAGGRCTMHDLIRSYAATTAHHDLAESVRTASLRRLLDYYLHCADLADGQLPVARGNSVRVAPEHQPAEVPKLTGSAEAVAWLEAEQVNVIAAAELAAEGADRAWLVHAWQLPYTLSRFFWLRADRSTWLRTTETALKAATELGDPEAKFVMLFNSGIALAQFGRVDESLARHREALEVARASGDANAQARALTTVADMLQGLGRVDESEASYREALEVSRLAGSRWAEANAHHNLGLLHLATRRYGEAETWLSTAVDMYREVGEQCGESTCHADLAMLQLELGEHEGAVTSARTALSVASAAASPYHLAVAHDRLAIVLKRQGLSDAVAHWQRALALFTGLNAPEADQVRARLVR